MATERKLRKALNIKQDNLEFHGNPSIGGMSDGQTAISKGNNGQLAIHRKKYGKEPTVTIRYPGGKKETVINQMIGDKEIHRYDKIIRAKTWRKR